MWDEVFLRTVIALVGSPKQVPLDSCVVRQQTSILMVVTLGLELPPP